MHATLSDVIADTAQNSIEAHARHVRVTLTEADGRIAVRIADDGKGMDAATCARAFDPFFTEPGKHAGRRVGLGLPILKQMCEGAGGGVTLRSEAGKGTTLDFHFAAHHLDLPPMGDIADMVLTLFNYPGDFELVFTHRRGTAEYSVARSELREAVGGLESVANLALAREFLRGQEEFD